MAKIVLDLASDLKTNSNNQLTVAISSASGNTLQVKSDGLYAEATKGTDGTGGTGYENQSLDYVLIGYEGPFTTTESDYRVCCTNVVHRLFDATIDGNGYVTLQNFRSVDCVLAGDMFRVAVGDDTYRYYLVTNTEFTSNGLGNSIKSYVQLGSGAW